MNINEIRFGIGEMNLGPLVQSIVDYSLMVNHVFALMFNSPDFVLFTINCRLTIDCISGPWFILE